MRIVETNDRGTTSYDVAAHPDLCALARRVLGLEPPPLAPRDSALSVVHPSTVIPIRPRASVNLRRGARSAL